MLQSIFIKMPKKHFWNIACSDKSNEPKLDALTYTNRIRLTKRILIKPTKIFCSLYSPKQLKQTLAKIYQLRTN